MDIIRRPYDQNFSGNPIVYTFYDQESVANADLVFEIRIWFLSSAHQASDQWRMLCSVPITPVEGSAAIDISPFLQTVLKHSIPSLTGTHTECTSQTGSFYVDYRRISIGGSLDEGYNTSEFEYLRQVIKGGLHPFMWNGNNFWLDYFSAMNRFLTWQQSGRLAGSKERMYLAWFNNTQAAAGAVRYSVLVTFTDGSTSQTNFALPAVSNRIYYLPAGFTQLGMPIPEGRVLWYWELTVQNIVAPTNPVNISETYRFNVDNKNDYNQTVLHYRNSLGGLDSLRVRGAIEISINLDGVETEVAVGAEWALSGPLPAFDKGLPHREQVIFKGDVGHVGREEQDRLRDAFLNREVWQERYGRWWPIKLLIKQYKKGTNTDKRFSVPIEWSFADSGSNYYTPALDLGPGKVLFNVCNAKIISVTPDINYVAVDTAEVTWSWEIPEPDQAQVAGVQWKIPGFVDTWQQTSYPPNTLKTTHAVPGNYAIYLRPICQEGSPGATIIGSVAIPISGEPPTPNNSSIEWNSSRPNVRATVTANGVAVFSGKLDAITYFHIPDGLAEIKVRLIFSTVSSGSCTSNDVTTLATLQQILGGVILTFNAVEVLNGVNIKLPA